MNRQNRLPFSAADHAAIWRECLEERFAMDTQIHDMEEKREAMSSRGCWYLLKASEKVSALADIIPRGALARASMSNVGIEECMTVADRMVGRLVRRTQDAERSAPSMVATRQREGVEAGRLLEKAFSFLNEARY